MCFLLLCSVLNKTGTSQQVPETLRAPLSTLHALWMFDVYMPIDCHKCISVTARVCASGVHVSYLCASSSPGLTVPAPCCPGTPWPPGYLVSVKPSVVKISSTCKAPAIGGGGGKLLWHLLLTAALNIHLHSSLHCQPSPPPLVHCPRFSSWWRSRGEEESPPHVYTLLSWKSICNTFMILGAFDFVSRTFLRNMRLVGGRENSPLPVSDSGGCREAKPLVGQIRTIFKCVSGFLFILLSRLNLLLPVLSEIHPASKTWTLQ